MGHCLIDNGENVELHMVRFQQCNGFAYAVKGGGIVFSAVAAGVVGFLDSIQRNSGQKAVFPKEPANQTVSQNIQEIYAFYKRQKWNFQQYIACLDPLKEPHGQNSYSIPPESYGQFLTELFRLWYKDWKKNRQPYIRQFENYIAILLGQFPESCDQRGTCSIQYAVEADGSVYPCDFYMTDEYRLGNFNERRLDEIDAKRREISFLERSLLLDQSCKLCTYYSLCKGGCQRNRDWNPETKTYQNYFCQSYRMFFDACLDGLTLRKQWILPPRNTPGNCLFRQRAIRQFLCIEI